MPILSKLKEQIRQLAGLAKISVPANGNLSPDEIQTLIADFVARASKAFASLADGFAYEDLLIIRDEFIPAVMQLVGLLKLGGNEKKALVLQAVGMLFDSLAPKLVLISTGWFGWVLAFLLSPAIRPIVRNAFLSGASALIEQVYDRLYRPVPAPPATA